MIDQIRAWLIVSQHNPLTYIRVQGAFGSLSSLITVLTGSEVAPVDVNFPGEISFWSCLLNMEPLGVCRFWEFMFYTWSPFFLLFFYPDSPQCLSHSLEKTALYSLYFVSSIILSKGRLWHSSCFWPRLWKPDVATHREPAVFSPHVTIGEESHTQTRKFDVFVIWFHLTLPH